MAQYFSALAIIRQVAGELGLNQPTSLVGTLDVQTSQLVALLNAAGNELLTYYPWEQLVKEWSFNTVNGQEAYTVPDDYSYFTDQTQWDRTNRWPLLGPKSPQEWAWLKGSLVAALPRQRWRMSGDRFIVWPVPGSNSFNFSMEYITCNWVNVNGLGITFSSLVQNDADIILFDQWLVIKFVKLKFYELKGFKTVGVAADFQRTFNALTGKDTGADKLSLAPTFTSQYIGPNSVPDGSWNVTP
jgi:hypothetical protein